MSETSDRKNVTNPPDWWAAFAAHAASSGKTLSEWMGDACRAALPPAARLKLSNRRTVGRPKSPCKE